MRQLDINYIPSVEWDARTATYFCHSTIYERHVTNDFTVSKHHVACLVAHASLRLIKQTPSNDFDWQVGA